MRLFTDRNGYVEAQRNFDPFGKPREASGGLKADNKLGDLNTAKTRRGFTDHEHLDDMELIHMNGRVYDYNLGRFLSVDPLIHGGSQGINPYSYMLNNPLSGVDPTGYKPETVEMKEDDKLITMDDGNTYLDQGGDTLIKVDSLSVSGSVSSGGITTSYNMTMTSNGAFNGSITSTKGNDSVTVGFSGDINSQASLAKSPSGFSNNCQDVSCNNENYGNMDNAIHGILQGKASHSDWFAAAEYVTNFIGIGSIDSRINAGFITDQEEDYLRFVHHSLAPINNKTFEEVRSGGFGGLSGKRLDDMLVVKEQLFVSMFTNKYFSGQPGLRSEVMNSLNKTFDHNSFRRFYPARRTYRTLAKQFGKGKFDMNNLNHRILLGIGLVDEIRNERGHQ